jgi:hypothetical protein
VWRTAVRYTRGMSEEGQATTERAPLGERPSEDHLALDVAQARIAAKLFGVESRVLVGRYRLLELVGRGGMGVVWGAWDPELERKVAIKLVDPLRSAARDRMVGEARALAKLSHPNVVPIYDVGAVEDRVYLVMEWVAGDSVRVYLRDRRTVREIVDVFGQAARGLAAVHAAGFVHRDFKPENAIVGRDGRVRVLDFGLAWTDVDGRAIEVAGTPRYMAPEQVAGEAPTPAVDQYALCIALHEALEARGRDGGTADIPRWLAKLIARGTSPRPGDRFASFDELIRALGRDPAHVLRRRIVVAGGIAAAVGAFAVGYTRSAKPELCADTATMPPGWSAGSRAAIDAHLIELGGFAATQRPALSSLLDERERAWRTANHAACLTFAHGETPAGVYERQLTCLARAGSSLTAVAELLVGATAETFPGARVAASALLDPARCAGADPSPVSAPPVPIAAEVRSIETAMEGARILTTAARPEAVGAAAEARRRAEATGYPPVVAHALLIEGRAQMLSDRQGAAATLERAMQTALAAHDDVAGVEAFARLAFVTAVSHARVSDGATVVETIARRLGPEGTFARLLLLNNLAVVNTVINERAAARRLLETAISDWRPGRGEQHYELASIPQNLALLVDQPAESLKLLARARDDVAGTLGPDHPKVLEIELAEIKFIGDLGRARAKQDAVCARLATLFPHLRHERNACEYEAAWLADEAGDTRAAARHFAAVAFDRATERVRAEIATQLAAPVSAEAARSLERLAATAPTKGSPWVLGAAADAYMAAARSWQSVGSSEAARRCWSQALPLLEAIVVPAGKRRLARVRTQLARMSPSAASDLARAAIAWYRSVGGYERTVTELTQLVDARSRE